VFFLDVLIIYFSQTGGTEKIAKTILQGIINSGNKCEIVKIKSANIKNLDNFDLIGIGTPTFFYREPRNVSQFINHSHHIFRRISHSTQREVIVNKGFVRGRIDWNRTLKERYSQGHDPTIFVCSPPARIYNLPENQLLKFILIRIKRLIEETAALPKIEEKNVRLEELRTEDGSERWTNRISWIKFHVNRALKHVYLRGVDAPAQVNMRMLRRARTARNKDYEKVADGYSLHNSIIRKMDREMLKKLVEKKILEPLEWNTLYELYVLFEVMNSLGKPMELGLIKAGAQSIGAFKIGEETIRVYFQRVRGLFRESKYKQIFEDYELDVSLRRPDLILHFEKEGKFLIIEVKRTTNKEYIVDSVYKVLGYLADFRKHFGEKQKPKGVLVVWDIKRVAKTEQDVSLVAHNEVADFIKDLH